jgi:hypothetical protein
MIDNIIELEDFKKIIEEKQLDTTRLRKCRFVQNVDKNGFFFAHEIVLTIPRDPSPGSISTPYIIQCVIAKKTFTSFINDKGTTEQQEFEQWIKDAEKKIVEHFGENVIAGNWKE